MMRPHLYDIIRDGNWYGRRAFVVGGGPSLCGFDFHRLDGELWIGCNMAFLANPTFAISVCNRFMRSIARDDPQLAKLWRECQSIKVLQEPPSDVDDIPAHAVDHCGSEWGTLLHTGLCQGPLTGHTAVNLADVLGANPIYLLGFDCRVSNDGQANYHQAYKWNQDGKVRPKEGRYKNAKAFFEKYKPSIRNRIIVLGDSELDCFEKGRVEDVLP